MQCGTGRICLLFGLQWGNSPFPSLPVLWQSKLLWLLPAGLALFIHTTAYMAHCHPSVVQWLFGLSSLSAACRLMGRAFFSKTATSTARSYLLKELPDLHLE
jgi:hypothetical protein